MQSAFTIRNMNSTAAAKHGCRREEIFGSVSTALHDPSFPSPSTTPSSRAHSIRAMATSTAFSRNVPLSSILAAATWSSSTVFTSFYLRDVQFSSSSGFSLGSVVAADAVV